MIVCCCEPCRLADKGKLTCAFAKLHDDVENGCPAPSIFPLNGINISDENVSVELFLHRTHSSEQNCFVFGRQGLLNVGLQPPEHERSKDFVQLRDQLILFFVVLYVQIKPFIKLL